MSLMCVVFIFHVVVMFTQSIVRKMIRHSVLANIFNRIFEHAGQYHWWQHWNTNPMILIIAAVAALLLMVIIICCIIICICRKRRQRDKCKYIPHPIDVC